MVVEIGSTGVSGDSQLAVAGGLCGRDDVYWCVRRRVCVGNGYNGMGAELEDSWKGVARKSWEGPPLQA